MKYAILLVALCATAPAATLHLLQKPAMNKTDIVFSYAGDLWTVSRQGGMAHAAHRGRRARRPTPRFRPMAAPSRSPASTTATPTCSPCPSTGGVPKRITYHPDADRVVGLDAGRQAHPVPLQSRSLLALHATLHRAGRGRPAGGAAAADGLHRALFARRQAHGLPAAGWRPVRHRRQQFRRLETLPRRRASYIWIVNFADLRREKIPRTDSNDFDPMWIGDKIYFLSDRNGPMTLFRYDPQSQEGRPS